MPCCGILSGVPKGNFDNTIIGALLPDKKVPVLGNVLLGSPDHSGFPGIFSAYNRSPLSMTSFPVPTSTYSTVNRKSYIFYPVVSFHQKLTLF